MMKTCPKCGRQMADDLQVCPNCGAGTSGETQQEAPRPRAVPNIPRREQDALPERPEREGTSGRGTLILLIALVILLVLFFFWMRK